MEKVGKHGGGLALTVGSAATGGILSAGLGAGANILALWALYDWMTGDAEELIERTIMRTGCDNNLNPADAYKGYE